MTMASDSNSNKISKSDTPIWREGARTHGVSVAVAAAELERIRQEHGELRPEGILEEARSDANPLHPIFVWDDALAAEQHRLQQARTLIRSIKVLTLSGGQRPQYVTIAAPPSADEPGRPRRVYRLATEVAQSEAEAAAAVSLLTERLLSAQRALDEFKTLLGEGDPRVAVVAAISEAVVTARELARTLN